MGAKMKILDVVYKNGNKKENITITDLGIEVFKKDIELKGYEIISINEIKPEKKKVDKNILNKRRFYNSQYSTEIRRLDRGNITQEEYEKRLELLKKLMKECKNEREYRIKYKNVYK